MGPAKVVNQCHCMHATSDLVLKKAINFGKRKPHLLTLWMVLVVVVVVVVDVVDVITLPSFPNPKEKTD